MTYLSHPNIVSSAQWRKPFHVEQTAENVLYTFCMDAVVRVWTPTDTFDGKHWQLWGQVDVGASIHDGTLAAHDVQLAFIIDSRDFTPSVERAVQDRMTNDSVVDDVALEHLVAVARKSPEICIAIDSYGLLSAWAFENVSSSTADFPGIFNIAQIRSRQLEFLGGFLSLRNLPHVEIHTYCDRHSGRLQILLHSFDGRIGVFATNIADLLDPTTNDRRLALETIWSGHSGSIQKMVRNYSGQAVVSRTGGGESIVWNHTQPRSSKNPSPSLSRRCVIPEKGHIHRIAVLRKGRFVVFLQEKTVTLWDCRSEKGVPLGQCSYEISGKPLCLIILPRPQVRDYTTAHIATVTSEGRGIVWEISLPRYFDDPMSIAEANIEEFCRLELKDAEGLSYVLPVDPAGSPPVVHGFLDVFARDVAISYTRTGRVDFWTARVDLERRQVDWLSTSSTETRIPDPALASGSMLKKAALVNSSRSMVTIWDIGGARLEFDEDYETHNAIQDLDWTSTPDSQSILAVGFQYKVVLLSQMRFDYLNKGPAWARVREIVIRELTPHPIGDSTWLSNGHLVIGAGNQMFVHGRSVSGSDQLIAGSRLPHRKDGTWDLFDAIQRFNGPLPVFHPQFVSQCILSGKSGLVRRILIALHKTLKYYIAGESLDDYLGLGITEFYTETVRCLLQWRTWVQITNLFLPRLSQSAFLTKSTGLTLTVTSATGRTKRLQRKQRLQSTRNLPKSASRNSQVTNKFSLPTSLNAQHWWSVIGARWTRTGRGSCSSSASMRSGRDVPARYTCRGERSIGHSILIAKIFLWILCLARTTAECSGSMRARVESSCGSPISMRW